MPQQYMAANRSQGTAQQRVIFTPLDFHLWEHFKAYCIQLKRKIERHLTSAFFCAGQTNRNRSENFEKVRQYMIIRVHVCIDLSGGHYGHLLSVVTCTSKTCSTVNPLKTKRRLLHLKTQSVPRCKHFSSPL